jgi:hypothetical protein
MVKTKLRSLRGGWVSMSEQEQLSKKVNKIANEIVSIINEEELNLAEAIVLLNKLIVIFLDELGKEAQTENDRQALKEFRQNIVDYILGNKVS